MADVEHFEVRSDISAHDHVMGMPIVAVVSELVDLLGATTVAVIGGVTETRAVQQWANGREPQRAHTLRFALQIATMIATLGDKHVIRAWFHGSNPRLEDRTPMMMLRERPLTEVQGPLIAAVRAFAARNSPRDHS